MHKSAGVTIGALNLSPSNMSPLGDNPNYAIASTEHRQPFHIHQFPA